MDEVSCCDHRQWSYGVETQQSLCSVFLFTLLRSSNGNVCIQTFNRAVQHKSHLICYRPFLSHLISFLLYSSLYFHLLFPSSLIPFTFFPFFLFLSFTSIFILIHSFLTSVVSFDAKINFDDNAKFRQKEIFASEDKTERNPREVEAEKYDLNYIGMDGNIACIGELRIKHLNLKF